MQGRIAFADRSDLVMPDLDLIKQAKSGVPGVTLPRRPAHLSCAASAGWDYVRVGTHAAIAMPFSMG